MPFRIYLISILLLFSGLETAFIRAQENGTPHLEKRGAATQLIVDGKPFLMIGGELHNSASSSLEYMKPIWPRLAAMGLNTVATPLSWELIEPREGNYEFTLVDGLLAQARAAHERIIFLWLASWKNGMSSYAPVWVKEDTHRFPRVEEHGSKMEILSPLGTATQEADGRALTALMQHLKQVDSRDCTVLMIQVENEVGVLGDTRDHSEAANAAFASAVPQELTAYLEAHRDALYPDLRALWDANGNKTAGTWAEVFGNTVRADEIFMAWHYARFVQGVAARGKAAYDIPMYVNTWLTGDDATPGSYPSGGPLPWVMDVWKAAGSALNIYAPDLYASNFEEWCKRYHRAGNPLFMPETRGGAIGAANVFYALGEESGLGFSAWAIEDEDPKNDLAVSYVEIQNLAPLLLEHQSAGDLHGFLLDKNHPSVDFAMSGYTLHVALSNDSWDHANGGYGLIMAAGPDEFLGAGKGFMVTFGLHSGAQTGIASVEEEMFENGKWVPRRRLNGDEDDQGKIWIFPSGKVADENDQGGQIFGSERISTEKVKLYRLK